MVQAIKERYPKIDFEDISTDEMLWLQFMGTSQRDYKYSLWVYLDGSNSGVGARLVSQPDLYFWYYPFDAYGEQNQEKQIGANIEFIFAQLDILTQHKTRIIQTRGWLFHSFACEYYKDGQWFSLYQHAVGRWLSNLPAISGKQKIYE